MSNSNSSNSRLKGCSLFIFILFVVGITYWLIGQGDSHRLDGKFYGYFPPSTTTFGSTTVHVGPVLYEVQFNYGENESDNFIKVKMQELETTTEKGGDWRPALEGTRFTDNGYINEYAKPVLLYGKYKVNDSKKSIKISGTVSTGAYSDPFKFDWVIDKSMIVEDSHLYGIKHSDDLCFEFPTSTSNKIAVCSTPKYFITKMIEEIEHNHNITVTDARKQELFSRPYR